MITYKVEVHDNGDKFWYANEQLHREDGPACECADGDKEWYINGKLHRENGPAIERASGSKHWFLNGEQHREDGPACEYADGEKVWYVNGEQLTQEQFNERNKPKPSCAGKVIEIDGVKYTLTKA